ncbi:MAG: phosphotransacetylase family protein [Candidatus Brocadiales bacterium]|nr:phosphotransacetylase family protein [Candidatus Bathyanammoxibius amoris]
MIPVMIGSVTEFSGKSLVWLGMGLRLKADGFKVGFFKPLGALPTRVNDTVVDEDALSLQRVLGEDVPLESVCPVVLTDEVLTSALRGELKTSQVRDKVFKTFAKLSKGRDIMLVHGLGKLSNGSLVGLSGLDFVDETKAKVVFVDKYENLLEALDGFMYARNVLGDSLIGVIFNLVPQDRLEYVKDVVSPYLKSHGIDTLAVIQNDPLMGSLPVREMVKALKGEVISGEEGLDELVEHFMVGAMNMESALKYFRRVANKAVVTGGDRSDIQLAALETPTKCLILTGGFHPSAAILARAKETGTAVVVVKKDTAWAVETCESLATHLQRWSELKLPRLRDITEREIDFPLFYKKLGLSPKAAR